MRLAQDYTEARGRFLEAARESDVQVEHHDHPFTGPAGEPLATDVAIIGSPDAPTRLLVISGTHGVEGFAGSLCQTTWLTEGASVPDDLAIVLVHAINPYGFAWIRRVNEDNVDLNRNCIDFSAALPENPGYDQLAAALVPPTWDEETQQATGDRCSSSRPSTASTRCRPRCRWGSTGIRPASSTAARVRSGRSRRSRRSLARARGRAAHRDHRPAHRARPVRRRRAHRQSPGRERQGSARRLVRRRELHGAGRGNLGLGRCERRRARRARRVGREPGDHRHRRSSGAPWTSSRSRMHCGLTPGSMRTAIRGGPRPDRSRPGCAPRSHPTIPQWAALVWDRFTEITAAGPLSRHLNLDRTWTSTGLGPRPGSPTGSSRPLIASPRAGSPRAGADGPGPPNGVPRRPRSHPPR